MRLSAQVHYFSTINLSNRHLSCTKVIFDDTVPGPLKLLTVPLGGSPVFGWPLHFKLGAAISAKILVNGHLFLKEGDI